MFCVIYCYLSLLDIVFIFVWFFFFQAEDGIRDGALVTGVQTCALPICRSCRTAEKLQPHRPQARRDRVYYRSCPLLSGEIWRTAHGRRPRRTQPTRLRVHTGDRWLAATRE